MHFGKTVCFATAVLISSALFFSDPAHVWANQMENDRFAIVVRDDNSLEVLLKKDGTACVFQPEFIVLFSETDPELAFRPGELGKVNYNVATWNTGGNGDATGLKKVDTSRNAGDGFDPSILEGDSKGRTPDYLSAAPFARIRANRTRVTENLISWSFPTHSCFRLEADVELPDGEAFPQLIVRFRSLKSGFYSIGYMGAPQFEPVDVEDLWQPLLWQGKRFPDKSYLTLAFRCPIPTALTTHDGHSVGILADPSLLPFEPLPTSQNSKFGVLLRNTKGKAQPMLFAPVLGGPDSNMEEETQFSFRAHFVLTAGDTIDTFQQLGRELYGFHDHRSNVEVSMNDTLANMVAYAMSEHSHFNEDLRGCSYATDVPGAVKNVSALHPLSAALVTDSPEIYARRARPIIEYLLSREKFLFAVSPEVKIQEPSWRLKGPCASISELAALYGMTGQQNPYFLELAIRMLDKTRTLNLDVAQAGRTWDNLLAVYKASGNQDHIDEALERVDHYIEDVANPKNDLLSNGHFFWTTFVPKFQELLEFYDETDEQRYLDAAYAAARRFSQFVWLCPAIPDVQIEVNEGGMVPHYWYLRSKGHPQMEAPSENVPAWRLSEIGLTCESSGTSNGHRAVLLANHAPWFLRLGYLKDDPFLLDIARSAIVGRYANFPGYHINTGRTTIYEKANYPLRPHNELSYNSFHYNHIWPHVALLIDYLVTEVEVLSEGRISFPSRYTEGYAYLKNRVYGDRPGRFYDVDDAWLWMPPELLSIDNPQINYVSARTDHSLCIALTNQSFHAEHAKVSVSRALVDLTGIQQVTLWENNGPSRTERLDGDSLSVSIPPRGILGLRFEGVEAKPRFAIDRSYGTKDPGGASFVESDFAEGTQGYLIRSGTGNKSAYVFVKATYETVNYVKLNYVYNDERRTQIDDSYPYEFTVVLEPDQGPFEFELEAEFVDGTNKWSAPLVLGSPHTTKNTKHQVWNH